MPLVKTRELLHVGIPVNDLARAEEFYTNILGLEVSGRYSNNLRLRCEDGNAIVLFNRPQPLQRNAVDEDGHAHHAFKVSVEDFDLAMEEMKKFGIFHRGPITWPGSQGRTLYFTDPDGNYLELWSE